MSGRLYAQKTALVTGASSGIGEQFAHALAQAGARLVLTARSQDRLEELARLLRAAHGAEVRVEAADLAVVGAGEALAARVGPVDILINNAGFGTLGPFTQLPLERQRREVTLNCLALMELTHALLPQMLARGWGRVINVSSIAGFQPAPYVAVYAATKAFVTSFSEALWGECRGTGVHLLALCPGGTRTRFFEALERPDLPPMKGGACPRSVVDTALRAVEQNRCFVVTGRRNYLLSLASRFLPRRWVVWLASLLLRRAAGGKATDRT